MKKRRAVILAVIFILVVIVVNSILDFLLIQPGLSRTIFHECSQGKYDCVILGASHGSYGLSTDELDSTLGMKTMNMCMGGEYMYDAYYVLKYAMRYNNLKTVVLDIDYQYLINDHKESILFNNVYNAYPDTPDKFGYFMTKMAWAEYRGTFLKWTNYWQCYYMINKTVKKKLSDEYKNYSSSVVSMNRYDTYDGNGFISRSSEAPKATASTLEWKESKVADREVTYIEKIADLCKKNNINIVFTSTCIDPVTIAGQSGKIAAAGAYIQKIADRCGVQYLNFNALKFDKFERSTTDYWDREGHMYGETARRFSTVYGEVVKKSLEGTLNKDDYFAKSIPQLYSSVVINSK